MQRGWGWVNTSDLGDAEEVLGGGGAGWGRKAFAFISPGDHFCFQDPVSKIEKLLNLHDDQMDKGFHRLM